MEPDRVTHTNRRWLSWRPSANFTTLYKLISTYNFAFEVYPRDHDMAGYDTEPY